MPGTRAVESEASGTVLAVTDTECAVGGGHWSGASVPEDKA